MTEELVDRINPRDLPIFGQRNDRQKKKRNEFLYRMLLQGKLYHLPEKEKQLIEPILLKYSCFSRRAK